MKSNELNNSYRLFSNSLKNMRLSQALAALQSLLSLAGAPWQLTRRLDELRRQYSLMSDYALQSADDPQRPTIYSRIAGEATSLADEAMRLAESVDNPSLYYSTLRYENMQPADTLARLLDEYTAISSKASMARFTGNSQAATALQSQLEQLGSAVFNRVWVTYPLSAEEQELLSTSVQSQELPLYFRRQLLSAVMLGGLSTCDERRLLILAGAYLTGENELDVHALCGLLLLMWRWKTRLKGMRHFAPMAESLTEHSGWAQDVKMVFLQFIRTRDTEKITRTIREELGPSLMNLKPRLDRMAKEDKKGLEDLFNPEENPEWMDMLEESGIGEKLRKMSELQQDGADVMMSSFSGLKSFPFFNSIANWFLPFYPEHTAVASHDRSVEGLIDILTSSPALCDSDKYSFVLSIGMIPGVQKKMMESQLSAHADMMMQHNMSLLFPEAASREQTANKYIQDLYRFFRLFRRKGEFDDPFAAPVNLVGVDYLDAALSDDETLAFLAEFYFKRGYYRDAADIFLRLSDKGAPDARMYQKLGYSLQQLGELEEALVWYDRAELIDSDTWTIQRRAQLLKALGRYDEAAEEYQRLDRLKPDNQSIVYNLASCMLNAGKYSEALHLFLRLEFLEGDTPRRSLRPVAWCSLLLHDFDRSARYYARIAAESTVQPTDMLNMGHLALLTGRPRNAFDNYRRYLEAIGNDVRQFEADLASDRPTLLRLGADPLLIDIIADRVTSDQSSD